MSRATRWPNGTYQKLPLDALSVEALKRVLEMRQAYDLEVQQHQVRLTQLEAAKTSLRAAISVATQQMKDVESKAAQVFAHLAPYEVGLVGALGKWLFSTATVRAAGRYYRPDAQPTITRWDELWKRRHEYYDLQQTLTQKLRDAEGKPEYAPSREAKLRFQSQTFVFDISLIDSERIESVIEKKSKKLESESERERDKRLRMQTKLAQTKAKAAAYEDKQRDLAKSVRTSAGLRRQLNDNPNCPYCNLILSTKDAHADHIHPVAKGGLSTPSNMVFVCQSCNVAKGTLTLRAFLKKMGYVETDVYERLERMGKDV